MRKIVLPQEERVFEVFPEGTHTFKIIRIKYDEKYGKLYIWAKTPEEKTLFMRYMLLDKSGKKQNNKAVNALSYLANKVLKKRVVELDIEEMVGGFFKATVENTTVDSTTEEGKQYVFHNLNDIEEHSGFEDDTPLKFEVLNEEFEEMVTTPPTTKDTSQELSDEELTKLLQL